MADFAKRQPFKIVLQNLFNLPILILIATFLVSYTQITNNIVTISFLSFLQVIFSFAFLQILLVFLFLSHVGQASRGAQSERWFRFSYSCPIFVLFSRFSLQIHSYVSGRVFLTVFSSRIFVPWL